MKHMTDNRLIVALDVPSTEKMKALVTALGERVSFYKVGMELFYAEGEETVRWLRSRGKQVFLDVKMYDIPNTVANGVLSLSRLGADMLTIHAGGGRPMMEAAVLAAKNAESEGGKRPKILAVTVLTSFDEKSWEEVGGEKCIANDVCRLAKLAKEAGVDGVVASAKEAEMIRNVCGDDFEIVTPGIRPTWAVTNDQKRIVTPKEALKKGASRIVIGRPVTQAIDPKDAVEKIIQEIKE